MGRIPLERLEHALAMSNCSVPTDSNTWFEANADGGNRALEMRCDGSTNTFWIRSYGDDSGTFINIDGILNFQGSGINSITAENFGASDSYNQIGASAVEFTFATGGGPDGLKIDLGSVDDIDSVFLQITDIRNVPLRVITFGDALLQGRLEPDDKPYPRLWFPLQPNTQRFDMEVHNNSGQPPNDTYNLNFDNTYESCSAVFAPSAISGGIDSEWADWLNFNYDGSGNILGCTYKLWGNDDVQWNAHIFGKLA